MIFNHPFFYNFQSPLIKEMTPIKVIVFTHFFCSEIMLETQAQFAYSFCLWIRRPVIQTDWHRCKQKREAKPCLRNLVTTQDLHVLRLLFVDLSVKRGWSEMKRGDNFRPIISLLMFSLLLVPLTLAHHMALSMIANQPVRIAKCREYMPPHLITPIRLFCRQ